MKNKLFVLNIFILLLLTLNVIGNGANVDFIGVTRTINGSIQTEYVVASSNPNAEIFMDEGGYLEITVYKIGGTPYYDYGIMKSDFTVIDYVSDVSSSEYTFVISNLGYRGNNYEVWADNDFYAFTITEQSATLDCDPDIEYIKINGTTVNFNNGSIDVELNSLTDSFQVKLQGENDGEDDAPANLSNLTLAFPQLNTSANKNNVTKNSSTSSDLDIIKLFGNDANNGGGDQYADYVVVEGADNNGWQSGESNYIVLDVKPKIWGYFYIEFRMGLPTEDSWNNFNHDPSGGYNPNWGSSQQISDPEIDPLGFKCYYIKVNVTQASQNGNIKVYVKDMDNAAVGSGHTVERYNSSYIIIDEKTTNSSGYVEWSAIEATNYKFAAYVNDNSSIWGGDCYWGDTDGTVSAGSTSTVDITQFEPFVKTISVSGSSFLPGNTVHVDVTVQNNTTISQNVKAEILIDMGQSAPWDYLSGLHGPITIAANNEGYFGFDWEIPANMSAGTYYISARAQRYFDYPNAYSPTDASGWDESFTITESITGIAEFFVYDGDISDDPASGAFIACYGTNNNTYTGVTDNNGYYQFILPVEHYYYDVFNQELNNGERELWASSQFDVSATQQVSEQVEREYPRVTDLYAMSANGNIYYEPGDVLYVNTDYHMKIPVFNNSTWQNTNTRVKLILDRDQQLPYDVVSEYSGEELINLGQSNTFTLPFNLTSSLNGTNIYMKIICESELNDNDWRLTDLVNWNEFSAFVIGENTTLPVVTDLLPADGAENIPVDFPFISVTFNKPMDFTTINNQTFFVEANGQTVSGQIEQFNDYTYTLSFNEDLEYGTEYQYTLTSDIHDIYGNPLDGNENGIIEASPSDDKICNFTTQIQDFVHISNIEFNRAFIPETNKILLSYNTFQQGSFDRFSTMTSFDQEYSCLKYLKEGLWAKVELENPLN